MSTTETESVRLGDLGTGHVWFTSVGSPAGEDVMTENRVGSEPLSLPGDYGEETPNWWDLRGVICGDKWEWDGKGKPLDWKLNTVTRIVAYVPGKAEAHV